jgi:fructose-bisphosphate aldolase class II
MEIGITGGEEDGVDNSGVKAESSTPSLDRWDKLLGNLKKYFTTFYIQVNNVFHCCTFGNVHGVYKAGNVSLSPHLLKGHQEYAKQQQLKCDEDKVDFFVLECNQ